MTSLLALASNFIDQLSNPRHGLDAHEAAAEQLAAHLRDEELRSRFHREVAALSSPEELTTDGWRWIIRFASANEIALDPDLLRRGCLRWSSTSLVAAGITAAVESFTDDEPDPRRGPGSRGRPGISDLPDPWLRTLLEELLPGPSVLNADGTEQPDSESSGRVRQAEVVFTALLIVDRPTTILAARAMLRDQERLSADLSGLVESRMDLLDDDARDAWSEVLGLG
jgi:hypothetical protein